MDTGFHDAYVNHGLRMGRMTFGSRDSTALAIGVSGNVGIGETNPTCLLDLGSTIQTRIISLYGGSSASDANYYGFGIESYTLRYTGGDNTTVHKFYGGSTDMAT